MKLSKDPRVCYNARFDLVEGLSESSFKAHPATTRGKVLIVGKCFYEIGANLWQENQFPAHDLSDLTFSQNSGWDKPMDGFRSYSAQRRSNSNRCTTGAGNASGLRTDATNSSASSNRSKSVSRSTFGISVMRIGSAYLKHFLKANRPFGSQFTQNPRIALLLAISCDFIMLTRYERQ